MQAQLLILMVLVWLVALIVFIRLREGKTPRQLRQVDFWVTILVPLPFCLVWAQQVAQHGVTAGTVFSVGCIVALVLVRLFRSQQPFQPDEALDNYARVPTRCGQCDYDLTGNASGICPECGWRIPAKAPPADDVPWTFWWKRWRIEHLDDWRKQRNHAALATAAFGVLALIMAIFKAAVGAAMAGVMCALFLINASRLIAYGRRQQRGRTD